jgi:hypothetical protein
MLIYNHFFISKRLKTRIYKQIEILSLSVYKFFCVVIKNNIIKVNDYILYFQIQISILEIFHTDLDGIGAIVVGKTI